MTQKYKSIRSPIKWTGGKFRLRHHIVNLLPDHTCYVEPFAGAAWVLFAKEPSDVEVINDINGELVNFFQIVKTSPKKFVRKFDWELVSREKYEKLANIDPLTLSDLDRAYRFYYLIMAGWGGESSYPRFQTSIKDGGHGNRLIGAIKTLENRIKPAHERLKTVIIENLDWRECIERYDSKSTVMYIDPPYPGNGVNYSHNMKNIEEHKELVENLASLRSKWILSSYNRKEVRKLFWGKGYKKIPVRNYSGMKTSKNGEKRSINDEVLIINF